MASSINQLKMNMLDMQTFQSSRAMSTVAVLMQTEEKEEKSFPTKDEDNYNVAMDFNEDKAVAYDEYMKYCEENAVSQYNSNSSYTIVFSVLSSDGQSIRPVHIGRALDVYQHFGDEKILPFVEAEV